MSIKEKFNALSARAYVGASTAATGLMLFPTTVRADGEGLDIGNLTIGEGGQVQGLDNTGNTVDAGNQILNVLKDILGVVRGIAIVGIVICLVYAGFLLASSNGNPQKRQMAMEAIKNCLIGASVCGGATLIISIFYGLLG